MHVAFVAPLILGAAPIAQTEHSFHWTDAAIGAAAGFGFALALIGAVSLARVPRLPGRRRRDFNR
jgi:hypothetical protein